MTDPTAPPDGAPWLPGGFQAMPDGSVAPPAQEAHGSDLASAPGFPFLAQPPPLQPIGTGAYTVDLERAPAAIRELEEALFKLETLRDEARLLGKVNPPGTDAVSADSAAVLGSVAVGGSGSLVEALNAGAAQLRALIEKIAEDISVYGQAENSAGAELRDASRS